MAAWKLISGEWLLSLSTHGAEFLRRRSSIVIQQCSSRGTALFFWTPVAGKPATLDSRLGRRNACVSLATAPRSLPWSYGGNMSIRRMVGAGFIGSKKGGSTACCPWRLGLGGELEWTRRILSRHHKAESSC